MRKRTGGFHHIAIKVFDFDATVKFYTEGLGFTKGISWKDGDNRAILLDSGNGNFIEIFEGGTQEEKPEGSYTHLALVSDNCDFDLDEAVKAGATLTMAATDIDIQSELITKVRVAFCKGLNGEVIEFFQYR